MPRVRCPECDRVIMVDDGARAVVHCPNCGYKIRLGERDGRDIRGRRSVMPWVIGGSIGFGVILVIIIILAVVLKPGDGGMDPQMARIMEDLANRNPEISRMAAQQLVRLRPDHHRATVARKLAEVMDSPDPWTRKTILDALAVWGTANEVPTLIKALGDEHLLIRQAACDGLVAFPDERAAAPLVRCLMDFSTRRHAEKALRAMGPLAEKELLTVVHPNQRDVFFLQTAVGLLKDCGTPQSVPALEAIVASKNLSHEFHVKGVAQEALAAIARRTTKK